MGFKKNVLTWDRKIDSHLRVKKMLLLVSEAFLIEKPL